MSEEREAETVAEFVEHMLETAGRELDACFNAVANTDGFSSDDLHFIGIKCRGIIGMATNIKEQIMMKANQSNGNQPK